MQTLKTILYFGIAFGISCLIIELFLNTSGIITPMWSYIDNDLGHTMVPDQRVVFFKEGFILTRTNKEGYLGPVYPVKKDPEKNRIALVGNSYVQGFHVFERWHFSRLLENALNENQEKKYEVLNFGQARFSLSDQIYYYENLVKKYQPDQTYFFCRSFELQKNYERLGPYYECKDGELIVDKSFRKKNMFKILEKTDFFLRNSSLYRLSYLCFKNVQSGRGLEIVLDKLYLGKKVEEEPVIDPKEELEKMSETTICLLERMAQIPNCVLVIIDDFSPELRAAIDQYGIDIVDSSDAFEELEAQGIDPKYWKVTKVEGHWNHAGQQAIARYLEKIVRDHALVTEKK